MLAAVGVMVSESEFLVGQCGGERVDLVAGLVVGDGREVGVIGLSRHKEDGGLAIMLPWLPNVDARFPKAASTSPHVARA